MASTTVLSTPTITAIAKPQVTPTHTHPLSTATPANSYHLISTSHHVARLRHNRRRSRHHAVLHSSKRPRDQFVWFGEHGCLLPEAVVRKYEQKSTQTAQTGGLKLIAIPEVPREHCYACLHGGISWLPVVPRSRLTNGVHSGDKSRNYNVEVVDLGRRARKALRGKYLLNKSTATEDDQSQQAAGGLGSSDRFQKSGDFYEAGSGPFENVVYDIETYWSASETIEGISIESSSGISAFDLQDVGGSGNVPENNNHAYTTNTDISGVGATAHTHGGATLLQHDLVDDLKGDPSDLQNRPSSHLGIIKFFDPQISSSSPLPSKNLLLKQRPTSKYIRKNEQDGTGGTVAIGEADIQRQGTGDTSRPIRNGPGKEGGREPLTSPANTGSNNGKQSICIGVGCRQGSGTGNTQESPLSSPITSPGLPTVTTARSTAPPTTGRRTRRRQVRRQVTVIGCVVGREGVLSEAGAGGVVGVGVREAGRSSSSRGCTTGYCSVPLQSPPDTQQQKQLNTQVPGGDGTTARLFRDLGDNDAVGCFSNTTVILHKDSETFIEQCEEYDTSKNTSIHHSSVEVAEKQEEYFIDENTTANNRDRTTGVSLGLNYGLIHDTDGEISTSFYCEKPKEEDNLRPESCTLMGVSPLLETLTGRVIDSGTLLGGDSEKLAGGLVTTMGEKSANKGDHTQNKTTGKVVNNFTGNGSHGRPHPRPHVDKNDDETKSSIYTRKNMIDKTSKGILNIQPDMDKMFDKKLKNGGVPNGKENRTNNKDLNIKPQRKESSQNGKDYDQLFRYKESSVKCDENVDILTVTHINNDSSLLTPVTHLCDSFDDSGISTHTPRTIGEQITEVSDDTPRDMQSLSKPNNKDTATLHQEQKKDINQLGPTKNMGPDPHMWDVDIETLILEDEGGESLTDSDYEEYQGQVSYENDIIDKTYGGNNTKSTNGLGDNSDPFVKSISAWSDIITDFANHQSNRSNSGSDDIGNHGNTKINEPRGISTGGVADCLEADSEGSDSENDSLDPLNGSDDEIFTFNREEKVPQRLSSPYVFHGEVVKIKRKYLRRKFVENEHGSVNSKTIHSKKHDGSVKHKCKDKEVSGKHKDHKTHNSKSSGGKPSTNKDSSNPDFLFVHPEEVAEKVIEKYRSQSDSCGKTATRMSEHTDSFRKQFMERMAQRRQSLPPMPPRKLQPLSYSGSPNGGNSELLITSQSDLLGTKPKANSNPEQLNYTSQNEEDTLLGATGGISINHADILRINHDMLPSGLSPTHKHFPEMSPTSRHFPEISPQARHFPERDLPDWLKSTSRAPGCKGLPGIESPTSETSPGAPYRSTRNDSLPKVPANLTGIPSTTSETTEGASTPPNYDRSKRRMSNLY